MTFYLLALVVLVLASSALLLATRLFDVRADAAAGLTLGACIVSFGLFALSFPQDGTLFGMLRVGPLSALGGMTLTLVGALTSLGALANPAKERAGPSEFYAFVLYATLGGALMVGANNLLLLYVALELSAYSTYVLVGYRRDDPWSVEASGKYFILGALSSAILLYGLSFVFGATGGIYYDEIRLALAPVLTTADVPALLWPGLALVLVGVAFKLALVPVHAWTPDAYQGAPTLVAGLLSVGPKAAVVIAFGSLLTHVLGIDALAFVWGAAFAWLAALTMTVGNLQALGQTNLKRMLGYSSVAQLGTLVIGFAAGGEAGFAAAAFYAVAYTVTNLGAFTAVAIFADGGVRPTLAAYAGLGRRAPAAAALFTLFLLSLAGVPLLAGFVAKLVVFGSAFGAGLYALAFLAIANTVVAYVYYFRVIIAMWLEPAEDDARAVPVSGVAVTALAVAAAGVLLLGVLPGAAGGVIEQAVTNVVAAPAP